MLPSKGFFKKNDCPFFEKGLCVRPHCHFRHRKKVLNEQSPAAEAEEVEDEVASDSFLKLISDFNQVNDPDKNLPSPGSSEANHSKEGNAAHDTLFAKLVNQTNTYEKINRHIPCAYTPTPQTKKAEPKTKGVSAVAGLGNNEKSLELIQKARTMLKNYCAENVKRSECKVLQNTEKTSIELSTSCSVDEEVSDEHNNSELISDTKKPDHEKLPVQDLMCQKDEGSSSSRVDDISVPADKPCDKLDEQISCEKRENLRELDFMSSEIELMKKVLNDASSSTDVQVMNKDNQSSEEKENDKNKDKVEESSHSTEGDDSNTTHKSKSSKSHSSSSRSKHSRSDSSRDRHSRHSSSSSHHRSGSSRCHSSSSSHKSSDHHRSSSRYSRDRREKHSGKHQSERKKHYKKEEQVKSDEKKNTEKHSKSSLKEPEKEEEDDERMEVEDDLEIMGVGMEDEDSQTSCRKRRITLEEDFQNTKYMYLSTNEDMDDDPERIEQECLEIFNSFSNLSESHSSKSALEITVPSTELESTIQAKKRTAHLSSVMADHSALRHKTVKKTNNIKSAHEIMMERYKIVEKAKDTHNNIQQPFQSPIAGLSKPSIRIAAVSNIQQMLLAKKAIQEKISKGLKVNERTTIAHTVSQGSTRVAHTPKPFDLKEKPTITEGTKQVPRMKRQTHLEKLLIETNKIYPTKSEAAEEALKLEQEIYQSHSGSSAAYDAAFVSLLMKTRRRVASVKGEAVSVNNSRPKVSHFDVLSGGKKNFSVIKTKKVDISMLSDKQIYEELLRCKLTPEELKENGFPVASDRPGYAVCSLNYDLKYNVKYQHIKKLRGNRRYCIRCSKLYDVHEGTLEQVKEGPETCSYHPGKKKSGGRNCERVYNCCNSSSTEGCATHVRHVTDCNDYDNYPNCVRTLAKEDDLNPGVFALDCEMVYTRLGTELARVTVVNLKKEIVYDTLVKPKYPIECFNTFYSGIEEKMMEGVETTIQDVQAVLLSMFSNKTILIGHSLDSDLRALHLIHDTVVDTSVVYKNEKYYPYKYSLKELCAKKISKIIQDNVNGHDSSEDAIAALEIMLQHVKEEVAKYDSLESYEADRWR